MKTKFLHTLWIGMILILLSVNTNAQEQQTDMETGVTGKFGIKGGINFSNMYIDEVGDGKMRLGWHIGVFSKFPLTRGVSLQPELLYTTKGTELTYTSQAIGAGDYRFNLNYVEVPVLLSFNLGEQFHINAGPYLAYLTKADVTDIENNGTVEYLINLNEDSFKRWDWGLAAGLGFDINNFTMGARYTLGLTKINNNTGISEVAPNSKNAAINIFVGVSF
jgi:hypothetical protein